MGPLGEEFIEVAQGEADIGEDGEVDDFIFVEFGSIDIDVNDGGFLGEFGNFTSDAVVEADAKGEEEIALIDGVVGVDGAVHPEPFEGLRIVFWEAADAHESGGDGNTGGAGEFKEVGFGAGGDDASADVEHGAFGFLDEGEDFVEGSFCGGGWRKVARDIHLGGPRDLGGGFLDVFGDVDDDGTWAAGGGDMKGFGDYARDIARAHDEVAVFDDGESEAEDVGFLESAATNHSGGDLAGDGDHGHGVHEGIGDASDEISSAWA